MSKITLNNLKRESHEPVSDANQLNPLHRFDDREMFMKCIDCSCYYKEKTTKENWENE